ncbi:mannose-6-phosphate isomerase [Limtongia smithiae]|uniref:mannose-6-phosphate isomerase n=1 Tax=Limtongia smithiae TaxID=1125753 RepID=UPI0034CDA1D5
MSHTLIQLQCGAQKYDWGKLGATSAVANFAAATDPSFPVEENTPYAELWMGTHPSVPSKELSTQTTLHSLLAADASLVGADVASKFADSGSASLPFLFKVLSIRKVLSIQAHPDKSLAKILHAADPKNYPDDNHKPEMAIALDDFEGFCGFRPAKEIKAFLSAVPEFRKVVGDAAAVAFENGVIDEPATVADETANKKYLQALFEKVMTAPAATITSEAEKLIGRVSAASATAVCVDAVLDDLILRLNEQFPLDIGLFCGVFLLNYVTLTAGQAIFLKAKDPHAYISGDIIECMAASDNVVRAGFTPKFKDVPNLVEMLTYECAPVEEQKMKPAGFARAKGDGVAQLYDPPIPEFAVLRTALENGKTETIEGLEGPTVIVVTEGEGTIKTADGSVCFVAKPGFVFFVGAHTDIVYDSTSGTLVTYAAFCEA